MSTLVGLRGTQPVNAGEDQHQGEMALLEKNPMQAGRQAGWTLWLVHHMRIRISGPQLGLVRKRIASERGLGCGEYLGHKPHPRVPCMHRDDCS